MTKGFKPLSRLRKRQPRYPAWCGNIAAPGRYVTDGHVLIDSRAVADMRLVTRLEAPLPRIKGGPYPQIEVGELFAQATKAARTKLRLIGYVAGDRPTAIMLSGQCIYPIDARKLRLVVDATGADTFRGAGTSEAVIAYRGRRRVAAIMPLAEYWSGTDSVKAALERWRAENKP